MYVEERQRHCQRHVCRGKIETLSMACMSRKDLDIVNGMYVEERLRHCQLACMSRKDRDIVNGMYVEERLRHCQRHVCRGKTETLSTACMSRKD